MKYRLFYSALCVFSLLVFAGCADGHTVQEESSSLITLQLEEPQTSDAVDAGLHSDEMPQDTEFAESDDFVNTAPPGFIGSADTYGLYEFTMPTVGSPNILVFVIDAPDDPPFRYSVEDIERHFFDNSRVNEPAFFEVPYYHEEGFSLGFYSMRDFFYRSSYGMLDITGDVISYTAQRPLTEYDDAWEVVAEILNTVDVVNTLDFALYDSNETGYTDGIFFVFRNHAPFWTGFAMKGAQYTSDFPTLVNGVKISNISILSGLGLFNQNNGLAHEAVHLMGLMDIDIHGPMPINPEGPGAATVVDTWSTGGDLPGIMKYIFGWIDPIQIAYIGETEVELRPYSDYPELAIVHVYGDRESNNWFVIEYLTGSNNNFWYDENANIHEFYNFPTVKAGGGLRVWRVSMDPEFYVRHIIRPYDTYVIIEPYLYLESVHSHGSPNHFFYTGDSLTPHTELNTNYPQSFYDPDGPIGTRRYMENLANSGIYIENIIVADNIARLLVTIREVVE